MKNTFIYRQIINDMTGAVVVNTYFSLKPNRFSNWEATFSFHIHGVSLMGADGLAFWYTKETSRLDGGFFGFTDQFTGLGIVIDTYDNDNTVLFSFLKWNNAKSLFLLF